MNAIATIEKNINPTIHPELRTGSTVRVHVKVRESVLKEAQKAKTAKAKKDKEQDRERIQIFEGLVIGIRGTGVKRAITVRKISFGEGVERIFPLSTPSVAKIEVLKRHHVRRAKLYYVRELRGKALRLRELRDTPLKAKGKARAAAAAPAAPAPVTPDAESAS